jgi:DNA-binding beta-propeller fold protein YncE
VFYATVGSPDKPQLITIEVRDTNDVTIAPVGPMDAFGCASLARSAQAVVYSVCGPGIAKPGPQQLATIDPKTGHATAFGTVVEGLQVMALEFAPDGTLYAVGDANRASPTFNSLYTVDATSGAFTRIGSTGVPPPGFFMDFAFDRSGTMYGATSKGLFTIDRKTGTATKVADFVGGGDIMGLSFDVNQNMLYATDYKAPNSALYRVDLRTGFLTPIAATGFPLAHGLVPRDR